MNQEQVKSYEEAMLGNADEPAIDPKGFYYIDFDKITRAEDIVSILAAVNFSFVGNHPRIHLVAHLLDRENVAYPKEDQYGQPLIEKKETPKLRKIELPKVKKPTVAKNEDADSGL